MKFTPGILGDGFTGSVGAVTASRNASGPYLRRKAIPVNPNTTRQQNIRSLFTTIVNAWTSALTQAQRDDWATWSANTTILGKDGQPINISGQNAYVRYNTIRLQIGGTRVDPAPIIFNNGMPPTSIIDTATSSPDTIGIAIGGTDVDSVIGVPGGASDDGDVAIYLGAPVNASRKFFKGPYQLADVLPIASAAVFVAWDTTLASLTQDVQLADLQYRSIRARVVYDDGRLSEKFEVLANVELDSV